MTKVQVEVTMRTKREIEVSFPIYFQTYDAFDSGGWFETYTRLDADGLEHSIYVNSWKEWKYEKSKVDLSYTLGHRLVAKSYDYTTITAEVFNAKVEEFKARLTEIPQ